MATKLDIKRVLSAIDRKDHNFYKQLTDEEQKAFNPFIVMNYISNTSGDRDTQEWFVEKTHESVNKHYWQLSKNHKGLLWNLYATVGVGVSCSHQYMASAPIEKQNKIETLLAELNPTMNLGDIKVWAMLMTPTDIQELFNNLGYDAKQRKEYE